MSGHHPSRCDDATSGRPRTLTRIRERQAHQATPVIFMTARAQSGEVEHYRTLGALDVITKPFDPMTLAGDVRAILAARR